MKIHVMCFVYIKKKKRKKKDYIKKENVEKTT